MTQSENYKPSKWFLRIHVKSFPPELRELYNYFTWFEKKACIQWNCRLAKHFGVSRRTICLRLKRLKELKLIWITSSGGKHRRIFCHHYHNSHEWLQTLATPKATSQFNQRGMFLTESQFQNKVFKQRKALLGTL